MAGHKCRYGPRCKYMYHSNDKHEVASEMLENVAIVTQRDCVVVRLSQSSLVRIVLFLRTKILNQCYIWAFCSIWCV
jgi:hypothetical protein